MLNYITPVRWNDILELLNTKRTDVGKSELSFLSYSPNWIKQSDINLLRTGLIEILPDYGYTLSSALNAVGYDYDTWKTWEQNWIATRSLDEVEDILELLITENWCSLLNLLNQKRADVNKNPISIDNCTKTKLTDVLIFQSATEEILTDYGFTGLADALSCVGYSGQSTWSEGFDCKSEIEDILNSMYVTELKGEDHLSELNLRHLIVNSSIPPLIRHYYYTEDKIVIINSPGISYHQFYGFPFHFQTEVTIHFKSLPSNINILDYLMPSVHDNWYSWSVYHDNVTIPEHIINQIPLDLWKSGGSIVLLSPFTNANSSWGFPILKYAYHTSV